MGQSHNFCGLHRIFYCKNRRFVVNVKIFPPRCACIENTFINQRENCPLTKDSALSVAVSEGEISQCAFHWEWVGSVCAAGSCWGRRGADTQKARFDLAAKAGFRRVWNQLRVKPVNSVPSSIRLHWDWVMVKVQVPSSAGKNTPYISPSLGSLNSTSIAPSILVPVPSS